MPESKRQLKVFLSYASQDRPAVRELSGRLASERWIDPWVDEKKLLPGQDWRTKIEEAVETSDAVIICLSNNSVTKEGFVQKELRYAREISFEKPDNAIFLIPLRLDECEVPRGLRFYQWVDYFGENSEKSYDALIESLKLRYEQKLKIEEIEQERRKKERLELEIAQKAEQEKLEREALERIEQERLAREVWEKSIRERFEREAADKLAQEKAKRDVAEKIRRERAERRATQRTMLKGNFSKILAALQSTHTKTVSLLRIVGFAGIAIALLYFGTWVFPKLTSLVPTANTYTITPLPLTVTATVKPVPAFTNTPFGGGRGQVIFVSDVYHPGKNVYSINVDGTGLKQLTFENTETASPVWSPDGNKIALTIKDNGVYQLYVMNQDGSDITKIIDDNKKNYVNPSWAPDGNKLAFCSYKGQSPFYSSSISIVNSDGTNEINLTDGCYPSWSPDGKKIAFINNDRGFDRIFVMSADGLNQNQLAFFSADIGPMMWSPDGKHMVFTSNRDSHSNDMDIYKMKSDGTDVVRLTKDPYSDLRPRFTPDGTKISWDRYLKGVHSIALMNADGSEVVGNILVILKLPNDILISKDVLVSAVDWKP